MNRRRRLGCLIAIAAVALGVPVLVTTEHDVAHAASLSVDLASRRGPATGVGQGFLYGTTLDGSQPADQFVQPLGITAFRGGGHASRGWIGDGYTYGSGTQANVNSAIAQARRFTQPPYRAQYQVILSDIYGADGGQPANTRWPCDNGDCTNWTNFIRAVVTPLQNANLNIVYDIWNEPDINIFWTRGINSTQYFQMWDTAVREIRRIAPAAEVVGPSFAATPLRNSGQWQTWLAHTKGAGTLPDQITNHLLVGGDDPVGVGQALNNAFSANGIAAIPLSANEYQPQDRMFAGVTAWYLARFAQSPYLNAMRANWVCCTTPNLTGILTQSGGSWITTGNWWVMRRYADLTGTLVATSGQVGSQAISAAVDDSARRAVAIIGDGNGYTGSSSVTFNGLSSVPWITNGTVNVRVERIPDQAPLASPQVVLDQNTSVVGGSITVPFTFQASRDAFAITLTPGEGSVSPSVSPSTTATGSGPLACTATYQMVNSWPGGFQGGVTVTNTGTRPTSGWTVTWTFPGGQTVSQLWSGSATQSGAAVTVTNAPWNGTVNPGAAASFGFIASTGSTNTAPSNVTCRAS